MAAGLPWAADDLYTLRPAIADWNWMLENGEHFFKVLYGPWFDKSDGFCRGQPLYHDITNSAYSEGMTRADCVLLKALSTNGLYYAACWPWPTPGNNAVARPMQRSSGLIVLPHSKSPSRRIHQARRHARLLQGSPWENHAQPLPGSFGLWDREETKEPQN